MASESKPWILLLLVLAATCMQACVNGDSQVACFFIFGDSLSDNGNNNNLVTLSKSNYKPYGIDFPLGPTGRFTNGRTVPDFLTQFLGLEKLIPPFANTSGSDILRGVNYASGAAGIRNETGKQMGSGIGMDAQIRNHRVIVSGIARRLGGVEQALQYLNKCLYYVNIGSNDYINNYFKPSFYPSSYTYNLEQFTEILIGQYSRQIMALHGLGARKFALLGLGELGCTPSAIASGGTNGSSSSCVAKKNRAASIFNEKLRSLVLQFNSNFSGDAKSIFVNSTAILTGNPQILGLRVKNANCCPIVGLTGLCVANQTPCQNREEYVFWDGFHLTEAVNQVLAVSSYNASDLAFTFPMDINHLVQSS